MNLPQEVSAMLAALLPGVRAALGDNLVGAYLRGPLALGDFLDTSDLTLPPLSHPKFTSKPPHF